MPNTKENVIRYLKWLREVNPVLYALVKVKNPEIFSALQRTSLGYMGAFSWTGILDTVTSTIKNALPVYKDFKVFELQLDNAKEGKPLADTKLFQEKVITPPPVVSPEIAHQVARETKKAVAQTTKTNITPFLLIGGGILAFTLLGKKKRR